VKTSENKRSIGEWLLIIIYAAINIAATIYPTENIREILLVCMIGWVLTQSGLMQYGPLDTDYMQRRVSTSVPLWIAYFSVIALGICLIWAK